MSNLVGTGIMPRARAADTALCDQADRLWARFAEACDADQLTDFSGLQALINRTLVESGECLVRIRERRAEDGLPVPAASVLHLFDRLRPGQVRGVPWFAPVILKLRDLDDYDAAELVRKKIEACFSAPV